MADWNAPTTATDHDDALDQLKARDVDALTMLGDAPTNPPEKTMKFDRTTSSFLEWIAGAWVQKILGISGGGTGATTAAGARTALGLGTMATQNANNVALTGGTIAGTSQAASTVTSGVFDRARLASGAPAATDYCAGDGTWRAMVTGLVPGMIVPYGGAAAPTGWLLCDGSAVNRTTYAALYAVIANNYGAGDGATTFNLPDLRGRFPLGKAAAGTGSVLGATGGSLDHTHTGPSHTHTIAAHSHTGPSHTHNVASHTHTIAAHSHTGPSHSHTVASHTHTISADGSHGHDVIGNTASESVIHTHGYSGTTDVGDAWDSFDSELTGNTGTASNHPHTHTYSGTTDNGTSTAHSHAVDIDTNVNGSHSHSGATGAASPATDAAGTGATSSVGLTTDASAPATDASGTGATSSVGLTTDAGGTGNTGTANPPYQVVNYIIKV